MTDQTDPILAALHDIRDGQREILAQLTAQRALAEEQLQRSRATIEESVGLQREALQRQRTVTRVAIPALIACVAAIIFLVARYL